MPVCVRVAMVLSCRGFNNPMESKFIPTLQVGNGYTYLKLRGVLDEDNLLANLISQIQGRLLLIDMAEMERINSCGVRDWVNWLNQIQALGLQVILLRCSPAVVAQANMVTNFSADAFIHSFYAPYVHPDTGEEQSVLLFTEDLRQVRPIKAPKIYSDSGEELEFDEFEESYFAFVSDPRMLNYQIPADIDAVIQYFVPESATHQPVVTSKAPTSHESPAQAAVPAAGPASVPTAGPATMQGAFNAMPNANAAFNNRMPSAANLPATNNFGNVSQPSGYPNAAAQNNTFNQASTKPSSAYQAPVPSAPKPSTPPASTPLLPTPSAPMRHEQPPIPGNQGYQHLPKPDSVVRPAVQVQVQQPKPSTPAAPIPNMPNNAVPQQNFTSNQPAPAQSNAFVQANNATNDLSSLPEQAQDKRKNKMLLIGILIGLFIIVIIVLLIILISALAK